MREGLQIKNEMSGGNTGTLIVRRAGRQEKDSVSTGLSKVVYKGWYNYNTGCLGEPGERQRDRERECMWCVYVSVWGGMRGGGASRPT